MYESFYNLAEKPFQISTDPKFLWLGEKHKEALAILKYGVLDNKGFLLITGDVGTGKTTLINELTRSFGEDVIYAAIRDPGLNHLDFFKYIAHVFSFNKDFNDKGEFLVHFSRFLMKAYQKGKTVVLIIDEAQLLDQKLLEQIRLLSNIEKEQRKLINIFFVGQNEFNNILLEHQNRALRQRITINYNIDSLDLDETTKYIKHRLEIAGSTYMIFNSDAVKKIFSFSDGYPRLINVVCDHAMLTGYVKGAKKIGASIIKECIKELSLPKEKKIKKEIKSLPHKGSENQPVVQTSKWRSRIGFILFLLLLVLMTLFAFQPDSKKKVLTIALKTVERLLVFQNTTIKASSPRQEKVKQHELKNKTLMANTVKRFPIDNASQIKQTEHVQQIAPPLQDKAELNSEVLTSSIQTKLMPSGYKKKISEKADSKLTEDTREQTIIKKIEQKNRLFVSEAEEYEDKAREFIVRTGGKLIIYFDYNANEISQYDFDRLSRFADIASRVSNIEIILTGYTDISGSKKYNVKLSKFRANIVKSYFVGKGVNPKNIISIGMGPKVPLINSVPGSISKYNRRVEIEMRIKEKD